MTVASGSDSINTRVENWIWRTSNGNIILNKHPLFLIEKVTVEGVTEVEIGEILRVKKNYWLGWVVIVFSHSFEKMTIGDSQPGSKWKTKAARERYVKKDRCFSSVFVLFDILVLQYYKVIDIESLLFVTLWVECCLGFYLACILLLSNSSRTKPLTSQL